MAVTKWTPPAKIIFTSTQTEAEFVSVSGYKNKDRAFYTYRYLTGMKAGTDVPLSMDQINSLAHTGNIKIITT